MLSCQNNRPLQRSSVLTSSSAVSTISMRVLTCRRAHGGIASRTWISDWVSTLSTPMMSFQRLQRLAVTSSWHSLEDRVYGALAFLATRSFNLKRAASTDLISELSSPRAAGGIQPRTLPASMEYWQVWRSATFYNWHLAAHQALRSGSSMTLSAARFQ